MLEAKVAVLNIETKQVTKDLKKSETVMISLARSIKQKLAAAEKEVERYRDWCTKMNKQFGGVSERNRKQQENSKKKLNQFKMQQYEHMRNESDAACSKYNRLLNQHAEDRMKDKEVLM